MTDTVTRPEQVVRYALGAVGGLLLVAGLRRGSWAGAALALAGGGLIGCAMSRRCTACAAGFDLAAHLERYGAGVTAGIYDHVAQAAKQERHPVGVLIEDVVEEASDDSFPCSDPPAWTAR